MPRTWLVKSEPDVYGFDRLQSEGRTPWDGIRNYQARNFMRDEMRVGDRVLFYHSQVAPPGVVGIAEVASEPYPDPTQFDATSPYHDPKATEEEPRWILVDIVPVRPLPRLVSLKEIREDEKLGGMLLTRRGNRLSVMPVEEEHAERIVELAHDRA